MGREPDSRIYVLGNRRRIAAMSHERRALSLQCVVRGQAKAERYRQRMYRAVNRGSLADWRERQMKGTMPKVVEGSTDRTK